MSKPLGERILFYSEKGQPNYGSVRLRCQYPASWFGAKWIAGRPLSENDLEGRDIFVLVKTSIQQCNKLRDHGHVIWDVIDFLPPEDLEHYIVSTQCCADYLELKNYKVVNHTHALGASLVAPTDNRVVYWIGNPLWKPTILSKHVTVNANRIEPNVLDSLYRKAGVLLNVRLEGPQASLHSDINSGIKLINSITYGIPSITSDERWVQEIGPDCTIVSGVTELEENIEALQTDKELYERLRQKCIERSKVFAPETIKSQYESVFNSL